MRLELRQIGADAASAGARPKWYFERGRRTLGRAAECDWQVPEEHRSISKLHCVIERDRDGFVLLDRSANGSRVDGVLVQEGETARLNDKSQLELGGLSFAVSISGERTRDVEDPEAGIALSDEPLTISAILADISSGGSTASGILGEREADPWAIPTTEVPAPARRGGTGSPSSRNVEIGWDGPPQIESASKLIPEDWYVEGSSGYGDHLEHGSATRVAVPIARVRDVAQEDVAANEDPTPKAIAEVFDAGVPDIPDSRDTALADRMEVVLARMEEALDGAFQVFDIDLPNADLLRTASQSRDDDIATRAEALLTRQQRLTHALEALMREATRIMEPRILEARVDAAGRKLPWNRGRNYWQSYRMQFERNGRVLSVRDIFRAAMIGTATPTDFPVTDLGGIDPAERNEGRRDDEK